ncbi:GNAT family N-acetyltransferase [Desulfovibrio sp.]|uniref:GNAT family N-acetyltransferase n=1 Tax=Desulfovibrio sp. TaxID=885 RepID=UPI0023CE2304|nr:GNAT family N-acetyltransferase [Desulfovibrio sp.]MDE7240611.1 GNAT family N-acetyltransferase [Desulfovibrio sp.]
MAEKTAIIRRAEQADRAAMENIAQAAYALYVPRMDRKPFPMLDDYGAHIADGAAFVLVDAGGVRGYIILLAADDGALLLDNVAIDPSAQKCGYGRKLLDFAEDVARERGLGRIILYTNEAMRENLAWYPKMGYAVTGHVEEKGYKRVYFEKKIDA